MRLLLTASLFCSSLAALPAAEQSPEAKLRETLRNTMLQLRQVQGEKDALQAEKTQLETDKKALTEKSEAQGKQLVIDKDAADKAIASLTDKNAAQAAELAQTRESLEKWKASQAAAVKLAQEKETARAGLAQEKIELQRKVADQRTRNAEMYKVGSEILSRYEKFGLGTAITAREPFTGLMKVKLENLVQDLGDKLDAQSLRPEAPAKKP